MSISLGPTILDRYILRQFLSVLLVCLLAATSLFLVFDLFERMRTFIRSDASFLDAFTYMALKIPLIIHLMTPVAVLIATLLSIGRLSQQSEITAMRACGNSIFRIAKPLFIAGAIISVAMFIMGETLVPWATDSLEEIYNIDIKKKDISGEYTRTNFWYRVDNTFYNINLYDSRTKSLENLSLFQFDDHFTLNRRLDAVQATWSENPLVNWTMSEVVEIGLNDKEGFQVATYPKLPLLIKEKPEDFRSSRRRPETMSYFHLRKYIEKLKAEGVQVTGYLVDCAAKISFPLINLLVILVAFPFALAPARSGSLTIGFICGISIGFLYYIVHAISTSMGSAELIPVIPSAWTANILICCLGCYLMANSEFN